MSASRREKKIADALERVLSASIDSDAAMPEAYVVFKLAERFHKLPHEIRAMPEADYRVCLQLMAAEGNARELKGQQQAHYGR